MAFNISIELQSFLTILVILFSTKRVIRCLWYFVEKFMHNFGVISTQVTLYFNEK